MPATKITTCCYCGTRAALVLRGKTHHELSCSTCGAPIQALKMLPTQKEPAQPVKKMKAPQRPQSFFSAPNKKVSKPRKRKRFKSFKRRLWDEFWDEIEDLFD